MTTKVVKVVKYVGVFSVVLMSFIACEKDFKDVGVNLVDNNKFKTDSYISEVTAYTKNIEKLRAGGLDLSSRMLGQYLLGVYQDDQFGKLEASIASQLSLPSGLKLVAREYGSDTLVVSTIDSVILNIPYQATKNGTHSNGSPKFDVDSVIGDQSKSFELKVYRLETFLNFFDPLDPSQINKFYSDREYEVSTLLNANDNFDFLVNDTDTVAYIKRRANVDLPYGAVYDTDTIKKEVPLPTIKIPLDETFFKTEFLDKFGSSEFESQEEFKKFFRGLFIEAKGDEGALVSLAMTNSTLDVYYTNTVTKISTAEVADKHKKTVQFSLLGIKTNQYKRDNSGVQSANKLYVQGAAGSRAVVDLFGEDADSNGISDELETLRNNNWLINEANLTFYVDEDEVDVENDSIPYKLHLFKDLEEYDSQISDMITEGPTVFGGALEQDVNGNYRYKFKITNYIAKLLRSENTEEVAPIGLKVFNNFDIPESVADSIIRDYNWNARGVVLKGNLPQTNEKRIKLEIFYSEKN